MPELKCALCGIMADSHKDRDLRIHLNISFSVGFSIKIPKASERHPCFCYNPQWTEFATLVRPPRIELGLRVPETLVISLSLRARASFLTLGLRSVNVRAEDGRGRMEDRLLSLVQV
jgi:hypothetical protein